MTHKLTTSLVTHAPLEFHWPAVASGLKISDYSIASPRSSTAPWSLDSDPRREKPSRFVQRCEED